ncbi:AraC-like ligand-binding domain-containing protein [Microbacterium alcoholitolerans]|uniref:AraC-like ligand-binding domain-containing protein n=1 Tax=unclassified Microbacterium TaxID=2609290 RepID=UPI003D16A405
MLDCEVLSESERFDAWRDAVNHSFVPLMADNPDPEERRRFTGALVAQPLARANVATVSGSPVRVTRSERQIARSDPGHIKLSLQLDGYSVITQDGRDAALAPGDFAFYDTTRPYTLDFAERHRMFVVMLPAEALHVDRQTLSHLTALRFSGRQGLGAIASSFLGALSSQLDIASLNETLSLSDAVFDMLSAVIADRMGTLGLLDPDIYRRTLKSHIEAHIYARLDDSTLTVSSVAAAHHISVRYLQKLFEDQQETVSGWIRHRRLEASRRDLASPASPQTIASIGARWGFTDAAAFTRAFRHQYGLTPSEYRASATGSN